MRTALDWTSRFVSLSRRGDCPVAGSSGEPTMKNDFSSQRRAMIQCDAALAVLSAAKVSIGADAPPHWQLIGPFFDDIERRTFQYFWDTADPKTGLVPDRWPRESLISVAAVGFALTAYPIG